MTLAATSLSVRLGARTVVTDATLELKQGELTAIIGPNGAGKSTLLRALAGLLPPAAGAVTLDGTDMAGWDRQQLARRIGYLPQSRIVHWPLSVERAVALGRIPHGTIDAAGCAAVEQAMLEMDVARFRRSPVNEVSGGELARVLLARLLAQETPIILADEPAAGLDPAHQLQLLDRFALLAKSGRTVAVAMHDLSLAARYCQRAVLLKDGRILADGPPSQVLEPALLRQAFGIEARLVSIDGLPIVLTSGLC